MRKTGTPVALTSGLQLGALTPSAPRCSDFAGPSPSQSHANSGKRGPCRTSVRSGCDRRSRGALRVALAGSLERRDFQHRLSVRLVLGARAPQCSSRQSARSMGTVIFAMTHVKQRTRTTSRAASWPNALPGASEALGTGLKAGHASGADHRPRRSVPASKLLAGLSSAW